MFDERLGDVVRADDVLHEVRGRAGLFECVFEGLPAQRRLARMFEDDGVSREHGRHDDVQRDKQRIVPRGDVEHDAERFVADVAFEPGDLGDVFVRERFLRDADHVFGAFDEPVHFAARLLDGLAHLARRVRGDLVGHCLERVDEPAAQRDAGVDRRRAPRAECGARAHNNAVYFSERKQGQGQFDLFGERIDDAEFGGVHGEVPLKSCRAMDRPNDSTRCRIIHRPAGACNYPRLGRSLALDQCGCRYSVS